MSDGDNPTSIKETSIDKRQNHGTDHDSSQEDLDPRIKKNLELLNDSSDKLNHATTELTYIRNRLNSMISKIEVLLGDYYVKHRRSIEKTRTYLKCLLKLKIEADSCHIHVMEYDASLFALDQCRAICNRLEKDLIDNNSSSSSNKDVESCVNNLQQLNATNEKIDYWTKRLFDQESITNEALFNLRTVYNACAGTIKRYKSTNPGMLYFRQQVFFYKCIHAILTYIDNLQRSIIFLNENYNDLLISTNQLTFELQNKDSLQIRDISSLVFQNYFEHSKKYDFLIGDGRLLVDKIFNIIFQMDYICTLSNASYTAMNNGYGFHGSGSFDRSQNFSESSNDIKCQVVDFSSPIDSKTMEHVCIGDQYGLNNNYALDNFKNLNLIGSVENEPVADDNIHKNDTLDKNDDANCFCQQTSDVSVSSTTRTSVSTPIVKREGEELVFADSDHSFDQSKDNIMITQSKSTEGSNTPQQLRNDDCSQFSELNTVNLNRSLTSKVDTRYSSRIPRPKLISSHKKTKSDFCFKKIDADQIPSTKDLFNVSSDCIIVEEGAGDLFVCNADVNSSKINMDISVYNMNSSFINNIHLFIALSLEKYQNLPNMPKIGCKKSSPFKRFF